MKANHKELLSQIEDAQLLEITQQAYEGVLFNEADYPRNREEIRCSAVNYNVNDLSKTIHWEGIKQWVYCLF